MISLSSSAGELCVSTDYVCSRLWPSEATYVDGAAQQRSSLQGFSDDAVEVFGGFAEFIHFRHAASEVLKSLSGAASW